MTLPAGRREDGRLQLRADCPNLGPMVVEPGAKLLGLHPIDAGGTGILLDASERRREVLAGRSKAQRFTAAG